MTRRDAWGAARAHFWMVASPSLFDRNWPFWWDCFWHGLAYALLALTGWYWPRRLWFEWEEDRALLRGLEDVRAGRVGPGPDLEAARRLVEKMKKGE